MMSTMDRLNTKAHPKFKPEYTKHGTAQSQLASECYDIETDNLKHEKVDLNAIKYIMQQNYEQNSCE